MEKVKRNNKMTGSPSPRNQKKEEKLETSKAEKKNIFLLNTKVITNYSALEFPASIRTEE